MAEILKIILEILSNNIDWIAPTVASLLMILFVVLTSKKQIEASIIINREQIKNNQIENHRPVINAIRLTSNNVRDFDFILSHGMNSGTNALYKTLTIKNIGNGVASSINLINNMGFEIDPHIKPFHLDLGVNDTYELKIAFRLQERNDIPIVIKYSDLYGNIYYSKIIIDMSNLSISCNTQYCTDNNKPPTG